MTPALLAFLRGWYPHWRAELRVYVADDTLNALLMVFALCIAFYLGRRFGRPA